MRLTKIIVLSIGGAFIALSQPGAAKAQSTVSPSADWNGSYGFSTAAGRNLRLLQADIIEKKEQGYYDQIGQNTFNVTNNTTTINKIGQQTTAVGVINNSTNTIDVRNSSNVSVDAANNAVSHGCQDATIRIDSILPSAGPTSCN